MNDECASDSSNLAIFLLWQSKKRLLLFLALRTTGLYTSEWWAWSHLGFWSTAQTRAHLFHGNHAGVADGSREQFTSPRLKHSRRA
ncbi:MAG: hypothetical protein RIS79_1376 [Verrucomicrobiota bacterium]